MKRLWCGGLAVLVTLFIAGPVSAALPILDSQGQALPTLAPMLDKARPAVVNIATSSEVRIPDNPLLRDPFFRRFFGVPDQPQQRRSQSLGSGVIVDAANGYVLTNNHVVDKAQQITVTLADGREFNATLIGTDPEADVAVIQIPAEKLVALPLANSDKLRVGDFVVAIGNPFGLGQTVTSGIVSALGRSGLGIEGYEDFIQTDASINPGNSGGALVNLRGELVGINTAIVAPGGGNVGIGFAIPINMVHELTNQLVEFGEIRRGRLGIGAQTMTPELSKAFGMPCCQGAVISRVEQGSAADKAGLKVGDVVTAFNDKPIKDSADFRNAIGLVRAGADIQLQVMREGQKRVIRAKIEAPKQERFEGRTVSRRFDGATFGNITEDSSLYGKVEGLLLLEVAVGSPAWQAGLRQGDLIASVNRQRVTNREEMERALKLSEDAILLNVRRGNQALFVLLQ